jgi:hypothetical protein
MSLALIQETAKEVRRLSVAGSPLAVGDFRLKKLIPPLEQAGAKVPVFAQVAKTVGDLVNGKEADSAGNLLGLSTLLNAILYTQGQTTADGEFRELEIFSATCAGTRTTARALKPLVEALSNAGAGRLEVIKSAVERGAFNDLRLMDPAMRALDDNYGEIADLIAEKVLPSYGPGIVPRLKEKFDAKGKKSDGRRLKVMHRLDSAGTLALCKSALEDGSADVKIAAIACLGKHEECVSLVLQEAKSKNKSVRAAALEALAEHDRAEVVTLFTELLKGKELDLLARPLRLIRSREVVASLLAEGKRSFDALLAGDAEMVSRYWEILACLDGRKETEIEDFLLGCFNQSEKIVKLKPSKKSIIGLDDSIVRLSGLLYGIATPKALETLLTNRNVIPAAGFGTVLRAALRAWSPDKVFAEFSPLLEQKKGGGKEKCHEIQVAIWSGRHADDADFYAADDVEPDTSDAQMLKKVTWDPRWLDAAIKADQQIMVCALARPGHKGVTAYLVKLLDVKSDAQKGLIIEALASCQYPKLADAFIAVAKKKSRTAQYYDWELQQLFDSARYLPAADLPKLDEFAGSLDEKFVDKFLEALGPLRVVKQPTSS